MQGIFIILVASIFNANFTLPMKYTKKWDWEHAWGMWSFWACLVLPVIVAVLSVPDLYGVYAGVPFSRLLLVFGASFIWGLSAIAFGIGVQLTGVAIGFSVIMGLVITTGTLVPLFTMHPETILTSTGICVVGGVLVMIVGIILCGKAGLERERHVSSNTEAVESGHTKSLRKGLLMCILAGVFGPMINFSFIFGEPIKARAIASGADPLWATNVIWCLTLFGGFVANAGYCSYLIGKNKSWNKFVQEKTGSHWVLGFLMGLFFMGGIMLYGIGTAKIGALGTSIGWALFQGPTIIIANLSGLVTGEWKNSGAKAVRVMLSGVIAILIGIIIVAMGNVIGG